VTLDSLYLEDEFNRQARFPNPLTGNFDTVFWEDRLTLQVMGDGPMTQEESINLPSPQDLGLLAIGSSQRPGTSGLKGSQTSSRSTQARMALAGHSKPKTNGFQRVVFLADYDSDYKIVKSHTAYLKLTNANSNVNEIAKLTKEYLNLEDDLIIVDTHGYEVMDSGSTRGIS